VHRIWEILMIPEVLAHRLETFLFRECFCTKYKNLIFWRTCPVNGNSCTPYFVNIFIVTNSVSSDSFLEWTRGSLVFVSIILCVTVCDRNTKASATILYVLVLVVVQ
jgi:hypothetical protein